MNGFYCYNHRCQSILRRISIFSLYTLIDVSDLTCIDKVSMIWVPETRALKIWVEDGLEIYNRMLRAVHSFKYYETIYDAPDYKYHWSWDAGSYMFYLDFCMKTDDGVYVNNDFGVLTITDVIDADGNSILKKPVFSPREGTSSWEYVYEFSDEGLALVACLTSDDIYPRTAYDDGGIIKFVYKENGYSETLSDSIWVDRLPYLE